MRSVVVVGAGIIGAGLETPPPGEPPSSHAAAFAAHPAFRLEALVESNADRRAELVGRFDCRILTDLSELGARPDVVAVCSPDHMHTHHVMQALSLKPRVIVCEKPLSVSASESDALTAACAAAAVTLVGNYSRRYVPLYRDLAARFAEEGVVAATIRYAKGLRHNGSHAVDLARLLFGEVLSATPLAARVDFYDDDPSITAFLHCERADLLLQALDERCYTLFELDVFTTTGRYVVDKDHRRLRRWRVADGVGAPPGRRLVEEGEYPTGQEFALAHMVENVAAILSSEALPLCPAQDASRSEAVIHALAMGRSP